MNKAIFAAVATAFFLSAGAAAAATVDYELNGNLDNSGTASATITNNGATLGATGLTFDANEGPTIDGLGLLTDYTLETRFSFDTVSGFRKIADFVNRTSDRGFYVLNGGLDFFSDAAGPANQFTAGTPITVRLVRDATANVFGYLNGVQQFTFVDTAGNAKISNTLHLFRDDLATSQNEASSGFVDWIRISSPQLQATDAVPEPAAWAMMILGFGAAGALLRRHRGALA